MTVQTRMTLAAGLLAATVGCAQTDREAHTSANAAPLAVRVATVTEGPVATGFEAGGVVHARTTATLASRVLAPVDAVHVAPGDRVRAGQLLVTLSSRDLEASARTAAAAVAQSKDGAAATVAEARAAEAGLVLARATHGRIAGLHAKRSATAQELDEATAALAAAEARQDAAQARVRESETNVERADASSQAAEATASFLRITAPFAGVVSEKLVEPGNLATPGLPLIRVEDTRDFRLEVRIDESRAAGISTGAAVDITLDTLSGRPTTVPTVVEEVSRAIDADARTFLVKIAVPRGTPTRSGVFGRARFAGQSRRALSVPADAVVSQGQVSAVFVVADGVARLRLVRLQGTEVMAGLVAGETVVVAPPPALRDGAAIVAGGGQ